MEVRCGAALQSRCGSVQAVTPPHLQWKLRANFRGKFLLLSLPASLPPSFSLTLPLAHSLSLSSSPLFYQIVTNLTLCLKRSLFKRFFSLFFSFFSLRINASLNPPKKSRLSYSIPAELQGLNVRLWYCAGRAVSSLYFKDSNTFVNVAWDFAYILLHDLNTSEAEI